MRHYIWVIATTFGWFLGSYLVAALGFVDEANYGIAWGGAVASFVAIFTMPPRTQSTEPTT